MTTYFRVSVRSGPTAGQILNLEKAEIIIGRDINNDIVINDSEVSRRHARLFLSEGNYVIEDLGSTNGTSVNGQRITGPYLLRPGELIMLGESITMLYEYQQNYADAVPVAPPPFGNVAPPKPITPVYSAPVPPPPPPATGLHTSTTNISTTTAAVCPSPDELSASTGIHTATRPRGTG